MYTDLPLDEHDLLIAELEAAAAGERGEEPEGDMTDILRYFREHPTLANTWILRRRDDVVITWDGREMRITPPGVWLSDAEWMALARLELVVKGDPRREAGR